MEFAEQPKKRKLTKKKLKIRNRDYQRAHKANANKGKLAQQIALEKARNDIPKLLREKERKEKEYNEEIRLIEISPSFSNASPPLTPTKLQNCFRSENNHKTIADYRQEHVSSGSGRQKNLLGFYHDMKVYDFIKVREFLPNCSFF